ncbi:hypothetical protein KBZ21_30315, partial [Streptomyces sp. A73]|nr:hypothetical protein [Streptomyces sp. A73]
DEGRGGNSTSDLKGGQSGKGKVFTDKDDVWGDGTSGDRATAGCRRGARCCGGVAGAICLLNSRTPART